MNVKKLLFVLVAVLLVLAGCGGKDENNTNKDKDNGIKQEVTVKKEEMLDSAVMYYLTAMTSKYVSVDTYAINKEQKIKMLNEALTDVNIAVLELEDEYSPDIPAVKDLNQLAKSVTYAIDEMLAGNDSNARENSENVGYYVGEISRNYLDGELPAVIKAATGLDNAN